ncbi:glycosyltransferase family 2 protein [Pedobacter deserti]|uniref:glycosyltransferase family 2 protein n=1 Tax=Pedobacter deserti TaxID=2817382 RepID=UPI00210A8FD4|nr:glycosyltransferase family 2 protein [Pedobacter sp. SYSU D00382]
MQISAVVITKNAEHTIGRCLESAREVADEVIVIDSGSTDRTVEIASSYRCKVISTAWLGYGPTKNIGHKEAQSPFILSMDSDEELSHDLIEEIKTIKSSLTGAYRFRRLNNYCGQWIRYGIWNPDKKIRLFPRHVRWNEAAVHEQLTLSGLTVEDLKGKLLHYAYSTRSELAAKTRAYAVLGSADQLKRTSIVLFFKMVFSPASIFVRSYFIKLGFLDGVAGLIISSFAALGTFLKYKMALSKKRSRL